MKPTLQLHLSQQLTLTPQLQQAIRLLQLSTLDLQQEIQLAVESNPMLELSPNEEKGSDAEPIGQSDFNQDSFADYAFSGKSQSMKTLRFEDSDNNFENITAATTDLRDHLHWQLALSTMHDNDRLIAATIIDAINDDGFLTQSSEELLAGLLSESLQVDIDEFEAVRQHIQQFDPVGCASLNLAECLLVQLQQLPKDTEGLLLARQILENDIEALGQHNYRHIMKRYLINEQALHTALELIKGLHPKPGSIISPSAVEYVIPDVITKKIGDEWRVLLNSSTLPKLHINTHYASMVQRADNSPDNQFLRTHLQEARWFLKSIQSRQETLLKVSECIVAQQRDFLEYGEEAMKPMVLSDIAKALDLHESTISRVTTQKFMHTPRGVFELKYFFSSHVSTVNGGECSSTAIRAVIKKLIQAENRLKPLSDSKIAELIIAQGIQVARRTVAKYREAMGIAPSNERKGIRHS